ncbi:MAG: hypothetical protein ABUK01_10480 [Leptospirales bacterium]
MFKSIESLKPAPAVIFVTIPFLGAILLLFFIPIYAASWNSIQYILPVVYIALYPAFLYWYSFSYTTYALCKEKGFFPGHLGIIKYGFLFFLAYSFGILLLVLTGMDLETYEYRFPLFLAHLPLILWWLYMLSFNSKALLGLEANKKVEKPGPLMATFALVPLTVYFVQKRLYALLQK